MPASSVPGVSIQQHILAPPPVLRTGIPAFLGYAHCRPVNIPQLLALPGQFSAQFGKPFAGGYLSACVDSFFANGGVLCYVVRLDDAVAAPDALNAGLATIAALDDLDLVCAPDIMRTVGSTQLPPDPSTVQAMQSSVLSHCDALGNRFAILDALPHASTDRVLHQRDALQSANGALYYPWIALGHAAQDSIPPCGAVAGIYARTDGDFGVFKAPANAAVLDAHDLEVALSDVQQGDLNDRQVNCLRVFPGRGVLVWGARTLSTDQSWRYVHVRRLFLTIGRWLEFAMRDCVFEPNDRTLWARIERRLTSYFMDLVRQGALRGGATDPASFSVRCDADTNPPEVRDTGQVIAEIGVAPAGTIEFIQVRLLVNRAGVMVA